MTSMVAKACSSSAQMLSSGSVKEKGSRNKRKFRADPPLADSNKVLSSSQNECTSFEFSAEKSEVVPIHGHLNGCEMCSASANQNLSNSLKLDLGLSCAVGLPEVGPSRSREEVEVTEEFHDADWSDLTESQLEELVLSNLDAIIKSAIKNLVGYGYTEEVATKAVLRSGLCYGCKDSVSNIVDSTLAYLRNGQEIDPSREHCFEDLQQMEKYILAELVCVLREVRPFFSTGDAMWCLLICDMNVSLACAMDIDPSNGLMGDGIANGSSSVSALPDSSADAKTIEKISDTCISNPPVYVNNCSSETPTLPSTTCSHDPQNESSFMTTFSSFKNNTSFKPDALAPVKESPNPVSDTTDKSFTALGTSPSPVQEEKFGASKRITGGSKREYILRQKTLHVEKHYRTYGSKGRAGKISSLSGLILDKKMKSGLDSSVALAKNASLKMSKAMGVNSPPDNINQNISTNIIQSHLSSFNVESANPDSTLPRTNAPMMLPAVNISSGLSTADTELSLSINSKGNSSPVFVNYHADMPVSSSLGIPFDKYAGQWVPRDKKDEMILKMIPRVRELQNQLQEWTEWANQKVMQAARRLSKDKVELKTLRQEKEEVERLKKEKQTLEENTMKKLSEMENALCRASGQMDRANAAVQRLEVENAALRQEMEAAKLRAAESAARCQEASKREKKTLLKFQSWEKQKTMFQEELLAEKRKLAQLSREVEQSKDLQEQYEAKWRQEEKSNEDLLAQASSHKKEREKVEASAKSKEDMIKLKAEDDLKKYKDDIEKLEKQISQLRLKTDSSKIAALKRGIDESYARRLADSRKASIPRESKTPFLPKTYTDRHGYSENGGVKRERECVMCLTEEISVVFLPCAHQVVCSICNELHEKQGMKDCPSCRSPIKQRICVHYACST